MEDSRKHDMYSSAVHAQLQIYQGIIGRMATNSASCKTWCITIVSAILVLMSDAARLRYMEVAIVPIAIFCFLDSYYLHLERCFIGSYNKFLGRVKIGNADEDDLFRIAPPRGLSTMCKGVGIDGSSISVWPFYGMLTAVFLIAWFLLAHTGHLASTQP